MKKLLCQCFLTWPIYLSSESAQKLTSRWHLQNSICSRTFMNIYIRTKWSGCYLGTYWKFKMFKYICPGRYFRMYEHKIIFWWNNGGGRTSNHSLNCVLWMFCSSCESIWILWKVLLNLQYVHMHLSIEKRGQNTALMGN